MSTPPPLPSRSVLTPWQRPAVRALVLGSILVSGTGLFLMGTPAGSPATSGAFWAHVILGVLLVPLLLAFTIPHAVVQTRRKPFIALTGALVLGGALAVIASGAILVLDPVPARHATALGLHVYGGLGMLLLYGLHRRFGANPVRWQVLGAAAATLVSIGGGLLLWEKAAPGPTSIYETGTAEAADAARPHFFPSSVTTGAGDLVLTSEDLRDVASCATCHRAITEEWKRSAHRHASMTNPYYRVSIEDMRKRFPKSDARWCAGCHDPALLFKKDPKEGVSLIAASELDFESEDARTGLTCVVCHSIEPRSTLGNADFVLRGRKVYPGEKSTSEALRKAHDVLLRLKPQAHVESLRPKNIKESSFCSLCHKAEPPPELNRWKWVRAQDEYDAHDDSGVSMGNARSFYHPPASKTCQDCHMPLVADPDDPSADEKGMVRSHLFAAANTGLPYLRGDKDMIQKISTFLSTACRVDVTGVILSGDRRFVPAPKALPAVKPGEVVEAHVVVRNLNVGHRFPGGTADSNEVWVDFEARVGGAPAFYASGRVDPVTKEVDASAEFYRTYWHTREGKRFTSRVANDLYTFIYGNRINPGSADVVRYRFRVPEGASGALELKATLRYRKFFAPLIQDLAKSRGTKVGLKIKLATELDYLVPGPMIETDLGDLPIVDMATGTLSLPITAEGTPGPAPAPESLPLKLPDDRDRVNDLAIAYLVQGDPDRSRALFETVTRIDPKYADGFVNVARASIEKADWSAAHAALDEAFRLKPGFPKAHFFRGLVLRNLAQFPEAEAQLRAVLVAFPRDRESLRRLADVLYQQDKHDECLKVVDVMTAIDAADQEIWYWAMRAYQAKGDTVREAAAQAAHDKFRPDEDAQVRRGPDTIADPNLHRLAQRVHVHEQPGLSAPR